MKLQDFVLANVEQMPDVLAITGPDTNLTYDALNSLANRFARALSSLGVQPRDRVGIWLDKSACAVAAMQGVLRLSAIYVPLDPLSPATRIHTILDDCTVQVLISTSKLLGSLATDTLQSITSLCLNGNKPGLHWSDLLLLSDAPLDPDVSNAHEIAYILYTSGSTGKPKGVCISHHNALAFITWAADILETTSQDRFANHAPFHFDLSVLDLYVAFAVGASVFLIPDGMSYLPKRLVRSVIEEELTLWYSVPSALILMLEQGDFLAHELQVLRVILFAGEPFPIKYLRKLYQRWPHIRFFNLYGPTETNVCTFYEVKHLLEEQTSSVPIGKACSGDSIWAQKEDGTLALPGEEGELMVIGPTVMTGYWGLPPHGSDAYATGDIVLQLNDGNYLYIGRRDHMVKVRGYRIELGDIETILREHPAIQDVIILVDGVGLDTRIIACVVPIGEKVFSLLEIKRYCSERLPRYMIVDEVISFSLFPRTRNGKIDRLALLQHRRA